MELNKEKQHFNNLYTDPDYLMASAACCFLRDQYGKTIKSIIAKSPDAEVLSLGSGDGYTELQLSPFVHSVTAIELSDIAVKNSVERTIRQNISNVVFLAGDVLAFPDLLPDRQFDVILALGFLHHLSDEEIVIVIKTVQHALRPGGLFISIDPNRYRAAGLFKWMVSGLIKKYHTSDERELAPQVIRRICLRNKFKQVKIAYLDFFLNPLVWIFPAIPVWIIKILYPIDWILRKFPVINRLSNLFICYAARDTD